jgi:hypothetical protein
VSDRPSSRVRAEYTCVYCGEPLPFSHRGVEAWRVGDRYVCNEFCADGISPGHSNSKSRSSEVQRWVHPTD